MVFSFTDTDHFFFIDFFFFVNRKRQSESTAGCGTEMKEPNKVDSMFNGIQAFNGIRSVSRAFAVLWRVVDCIRHSHYNKNCHGA